MPHVIFVCTANICRSPVAEAVLRQRFQERGLESWTVGSAGTWAEEGRPASTYSVQVAAARGLDISDHRARLVTREMLAQADLVLCMTEGHAEALRAEFPTQAAKIYLLTEMAGKHYNISDPYGRSLRDYEQMAAEVMALIDEGLPRILEIGKANW
ncbi:MAG: low molecular weight protein arginine phosphatase [Chloroflexota bacterium]